MEIVSCFIFGFYVLLFSIVVINYFSEPILKTAKLSYSPFVSVLIPARNEENNIGRLLSALEGISYMNMEIIVCNDQSEDNTANIVIKHQNRSKLIKLINIYELPDGWTGKNYACHLLASNASGDYLLFIDADVIIEKGLIESALNHLIKNKLALLSIFPVQIMVSLGEKIVVPFMNSILLSLLPLFLVKRSKYPSLSAANGQFMLFNKSTYLSLLPHNQVKAERVEDIAIAAYLKNNGKQIDCLTGNNTIKCRMYSGFWEAINGLSRSVAAFFGNSIFTGILYWVLTTAGVFLIILYLPVIYSLLFFAGLIISGICIAKTSNQNPRDYIIYMLPRQIAVGLILLTALRNKITGNYKWKGRKMQ